ncbi:MAG: non-canonical purine NTP pyrophosphatase, partial [Candidatus Acidiferrales bacterium]
MRAPHNRGTEGIALKLYLASSNPGKLREFTELAAESSVDGFEIAALPEIAKFPAYEETATTFAENAAGKALHYSQFTDEAVLADDSGLVVPALGGAPGVYSARYAGPSATDADRVAKLLGEMKDMTGDARRAQFVCVMAVSRRGRALSVVSDLARGLLTDAPVGTGGFGYDPIFLFPPLGRTYA